jgi:hypothetical protein
MVAACLVVILAAIPCLLTPKVYPQFGLAAIWFFGAGLFMMLVGAINLLRIRYAGAAPGVRIVCIVANLVLLAFLIAIAFTVTLKQNPQVIIFLVLAALLTISSVMRRPIHA